jgi:hypothetical protein
MYLPACYADSWVEISSQPSSSSLSSVGGENEIVTTGLQIRRDSTLGRKHRRRSLHADSVGGIWRSGRPTSAAGSSQEDYDESESESDQALSSSNEEIPVRDNNLNGGPGLLQDEEAEDDDSTALGTASSVSNEKAFTPQPNAFSHPPSSQINRHLIGSNAANTDSYFPPTASNAPVGTRVSSTSTVAPQTHQPTHSGLPPLPPRPTTRSHASCNVIGPSRTYQPDHDAALRASLSTLLSCAAAVRGSPKQHEAPSTAESRYQSEPTALRLVPESELFNTDPGQATSSFPACKTRGSNSTPPLPGMDPKAATKRKARESSKERYAKKSRATKHVAGSNSIEEATVSPLLMGWMISAGMVLVFSAISFTAGYAWGREVGRFEGFGGVGAGPEAAAAASSSAAGCGRDAIRGSTNGLRRLRWGAAATSSSAVRA